MSGSFNESILLYRSWSNCAAVVNRISGIPSSVSWLRLSFFVSASINKLKTSKNFCISWSSISI